MRDYRGMTDFDHDIEQQLNDMGAWQGDDPYVGCEMPTPTSPRYMFQSYVAEAAGRPGRHLCLSKAEAVGMIAAAHAVLQARRSDE